MTPEIASRILAVAWLGVMAAACSSSSATREVGSTLVGPSPNVSSGAPAGGALGSTAGEAPAGNRVSSAAAGAAISGMIGSRIGGALDDEDKRRAYAAQVQALEGGPSGAPVAWRNPDSGRYGSVVPGQAYQANGVNCRQFTHTVYIDGKPQTARGAACRGPDGVWQAG
jgi:surface antigen